MIDISALKKSFANDAASDLVKLHSINSVEGAMLDDCLLATIEAVADGKRHTITVSGFNLTGARAGEELAFAANDWALTRKAKATDGRLNG